MAYIDGFLAPVPSDGQAAFLDHARTVDGYFQEHGIQRATECWGDDVPHGHHTDFYRAVAAKDGETVVFAWMESASRDARNAAMTKAMADERMQTMAMPFDGQRMIFGGFEAFVDVGAGGGSYIDGFLIPVPADKVEAYRALATRVAPVFLGHGAVRVVEAFDDDVPDGKVTDFRRAVAAEPGERIVFSFVEWPDKATRDTGQKAVMEDPAMGGPEDMPFDGKRMVFGGFSKILEM